MLSNFLIIGKNKPPISVNLNDITFGNNTYVAVGDTGVIYTSNDGSNWTLQTSGTSNNLVSIKWTGSLFFTCGTVGTLLTSTNGKTWTDRSIAISENFNRCSIANGVYFVTGGSGTVGRLYSSTNGTTWTGQTLSSGMARTLYDVVYYNNGSVSRYYTVGSIFGVSQQPAYGLSTNYTSWTDSQGGIPASTGNGRGLYSSGSILVMLSSQPSTAYTRLSSSTDGTTYTARFTGTASGRLPNKGLWTGTKFILTGAAGYIYSSTDGITWTETNISSNTLNGIVKNGSEIIIVGASGTIARSINDGSTWSFL